MALFLSLLFLSSFALASKLVVSEPVQVALHVGSSIDLGIIGPGQKIIIAAKRASGEASLNSPTGGEALWDRLLVDSLPLGWVSEPSKFYEEPFQAFVTASPEAEDGDYYFALRTIDEYDGLAPLAATAKVKVSKDVLGLAVQNPELRVGVDQPAVFFLKLQNTGSASDVFEVSAEGLPASWVSKKKVFVPHNSVVSMAYEIVPKENGEYPLVFKADSLSSKEISKQASASMTTETSVWNDIRASANGILLFPSIQQALYSLWAFAAHLIV